MTSAVRPSLTVTEDRRQAVTGSHRLWPFTHVTKGTEMATMNAMSDAAEGAKVDVISGSGGAEVSVAADGAAADLGDADQYQERLGARLRAVRRAQGLRLQDVEERSEGRFKAVVVGSYERGDRAVSAHKLAALAAFYEVPVVELLPEEEWPRTTRGESTLALAVDRLRERADDPDLVPLLRLVQHVQWLRDDYNGRVLSLRADDLRTVAIALGAAPESLDTWLDDRGLLHR